MIRFVDDPGDGPEARVQQSAPVQAPSTWDVGTFDEATVAAGVAKVAGFPGYPADDNQIATFWPQPKRMPTIAEIDFGSVKADTVDLAELLSSNRTIKRDRLLWHVQNPGQRINVNPFTSMPLIIYTKWGPTVVDGHHSLGALWVLGAKKAPVWVLPMSPTSPNAAAN